MRCLRCLEPRHLPLFCWLTATVVSLYLLPVRLADSLRSGWRPLLLLIFRLRDLKVLPREVLRESDGDLLTPEARRALQEVRTTDHPLVHEEEEEEGTPPLRWPVVGHGWLAPRPPVDDGGPSRCLGRSGHAGDPIESPEAGGWQQRRQGRGSRGRGERRAGSQGRHEVSQQQQAWRREGGYRKPCR